MKVLVVGAGLAGLAAGCHLRAAGFEVEVVERDEQVGGRAGTLVSHGFRFDTGPVVLTMPELLAEPLLALGVDPARALPLRRLDPSYRAHFADGSSLEVSADMGALRRQVESVCSPVEARALDRFLSWLEDLYRTEFDAFLDRNYDSVLGLLDSPAHALRLVRLGGFRSLEKTVSAYFADDRLRRIFSFQALYAGVAPRRARALLAVISYMDVVRGVFYPATGGIHAAPRALAAALTAAGGVIRTGTTTVQILRRGGGAVRGALLGTGEVATADAVVCTVDLPVAYRTLLPDLVPPRALRRPEYSPSALVWHLGVRGTLPAHTAHHNIHFGRAWSEAFAALIDRRSLMPDPSRLVTVPSVTDPGVAPAGHNTLYVLEPVPHLGAAMDWTAQVPGMRQRLLEMLDRNGYPTDIVVEHLVTPVDWAERGMAAGTPFSLAHTFLQSGPFRPRNLDPRAPGLFFAGSGTTPGVGVPMVLLSGKHAAQRVEAFLRPGRRDQRP